MYFTTYRNLDLTNCRRVSRFSINSRTMNAATILLVLVIGLAYGQLNFEGNPLTEDTEYTAVESRFSEKTAGQQETTVDVINASAESPQNVHLLFSDVKNSSQYANPTKTSIDDHPVNHTWSHLERQQRIVQSGRHLSANTYNQGIASVNNVEVALNSFLNSKTPEESRLSLDHYLQSREIPQNAKAIITNQQQLTQQPVTRVNQETVSSPVNQHLTAQLMQQRQAPQTFPVGQPANQPTYGAPVNSVDLRSTMSNPATASLMQQQQMLQPYASRIQARNDVYYPGWYQRVRRVRGKPFPYAQSRGGPGFYAGPVPPGDILLTRS